MGVAGQGDNRSDEAGKLRMGMNWQVWKWKLGRLFRLTQTEQDLDEEIRAHLAIETRQRIERRRSTGSCPAGGSKGLRKCRSRKGGNTRNVDFTSLERLWQDARYAVRSLRDR